MVIRTASYSLTRTAQWGLRLAACCVTLIAGLAWSQTMRKTDADIGPAEAASSWHVSVPHCGETTGETTVKVVFPFPSVRMPVTFGIPLGQASSPRRVLVQNDAGELIPADVTSLGLWDSQPARWALVSCVLDGRTSNGHVPLTLRWGCAVPETNSAMRTTVGGDVVAVTNTHYRIRVSSRGVEALENAGMSAPFEIWRPAFVTKDGATLRPQEGRLLRLYDGPIHQAIRFTSNLNDTLEVHQEYDFYAGSPFIRCRVRYINRSIQDIPVGAIVVVELRGLTDVSKVRVGISENGQALEGAAAEVVQEAFGWRVSVERKKAEGAKDDLGEWISFHGKGRRKGLMLVFPHFQEMAAGDQTAFSEYAYRDGGFRVKHYAALPGQTTDIRLREGMARTFEYWLAAATTDGQESAAAQAIKHPPYVVYDRKHLTKMGVFQEKRVSHLFDKELLEAALYFKRAQVPRTEYPRCSRGADPGPDKSGEGFYEVDLHAGGMVFGEVFQYFEPTPPESMRRQYHEEIGISPEHIVTGGTCTYRNGDIVLALCQEYLRSGDGVLAHFAPIHAGVFADVGISHAPESNGLGHYYCDWYVNPYVYQRFEGLLLAGLITGDRWWLDTAKDMANYCVRAWKDGRPCDGQLNGGLGESQLRSPYIAKMLLRMYDVTGEQKYADTAVRLAQWILPLQEPQGWWRDTPDSTREYRNSPIFAGYTCTGLWPLYSTTRNPELRATLMKAVDYQVGMQEDAKGNHPGTFPNSYWYRTKEGRNTTTPIPDKVVIQANYGVTSHWANIILQAYRETGNRDYFYSANAAWVGVLNHLTSEGGVPLSGGGSGAVWGHVLIESLADFAATAEERRLPIVMGSWEGQPVDCFMGKGAAYRDGVFTFGLKYRHKTPLPVRVFFPSGPPSAIIVENEVAEFDYDAQSRALTFRLPPASDWRVVRLIISCS